MATGQRIRFFRNLRGMTQKYLGMMVGFSERTADIRMAQYESGKRTPKSNLINELSRALSVSPDALAVPDIDSEIGLMHTLFAIEDIYGLTISEIDSKPCLTWLKVEQFNLSLMQRFTDWQKEAERLRSGEITKEEYDQWRYTYPKIPVARQKIARDAARMVEKQTEKG